MPHGAKWIALGDRNNCFYNDKVATECHRIILLEDTGRNCNVIGFDFTGLLMVFSPFNDMVMGL